MKKNMIAAVAVVIVLLAAGAYVVLSMNAPDDKGKDNGDDNNNNNGNNNGNNGSNGTNPPPLSTIDLGLRTMNITLPRDLGSAAPKVSLEVSYPGQGQSNITYNRAQTYRFHINSTPAAGYSGDVLIRMFAELTDPIDEIDPQNLIVTTATGRTLEWTTDIRSGDYVNHIVISGDLGAFRTNGNATDSRAFDVVLNYVGNFTLTFQAFDLNSNETLSAPTTAGPMWVPIKGSLSVSALSGEWRTNVNGTFFVVLVNFTNNWNIRHTVYASGLVINNGDQDFTANSSATAFVSRQLIPLNGNTQFLAWFDVTGDRADFTMRYNDPVSGETYNVTLPPGSG